MTTTQQGKLTDEEIVSLVKHLDLFDVRPNGRIESGYRDDADITAYLTSFARTIEAEVEARTAKKMDALVEALRDAAKDMRAAAATIDEDPNGAIVDTVWHGAVTLYDHLCASAEQVETSLAAHQQDTVAENEPGMLSIRADVVEFLNGAGLLKGCAFGERPLGAKGEFWWREYLPAAPVDGVGEGS